MGGVVVIGGFEGDVDIGVGFVVVFGVGVFGEDCVVVDGLIDVGCFEVDCFDVVFD